QHFAMKQVLNKTKFYLTMDSFKNPNPYCGRCTDGIVFTPYRTVKGKMLYRKNGKMWAFPCSCTK
ncbi:MAG: hypothetical protein ABI325_05175, partial [Ginsengibacter sp.]